MIRVLLVDDQAVVRRVLRTRFFLEPDLQVVGEASTGREALTLAQTLSPDVVLMDIAMPGMDGIEATVAMHRKVPQSAVIILSISDDRQTREQAQAAGVVAFVEKRGATEKLLSAIRLAFGQAGTRYKGEKQWTVHPILRAINRWTVLLWLLIRSNKLHA